MREAHPREAAELIRQDLGVIEARGSRIDVDRESLASRWRVREWRLGRHPEPEAEPCPNEDDEKTAATYRRGARAAAAVEIVLAAVLGFFAGYGTARIPIALGCGLLALAVVTIAEPGVRTKLWDEERPLETRLRLRGAAWKAVVAAGVSLLPLLLLLRGGGGHGIQFAMALAWLPLTLSISTLTGVLFLLAHCHDDLLAREYRRAEDERVRLDLFREELVRLLDELPLRPARNGRNGRRKVAVGCLAALLVASRPSMAFTTIEVLVDTTGSVDPIAMDRAGTLLSSSLPVLSLQLGIERLEVGGWGAPSVWLPPALSVSFPPPRVQGVHAQLAGSGLGRYFASYAREEEAERQKRESAAEATRADVVQKGCTEAGELVRRLARAGMVPEKECTPVGDLLARCARSPATTLTLVVTDGLSCPGRMSIPASAAGRTIVIVVPGKGPNGRRVEERVAVLQAPWLRAVPCSLLDGRGEWFQQVAGDSSIGHDSLSAGSAP